MRRSAGLLVSDALARAEVVEARVAAVDEDTARHARQLTSRLNSKSHKKPESRRNLVKKLTVAVF